MIKPKYKTQLKSKSRQKKGQVYSCSQKLENRPRLTKSINGIHQNKNSRSISRKGRAQDSAKCEKINEDRTPNVINTKKIFLNNYTKIKAKDVIPQILKNIEKNCKALKKIHQKEVNYQQKRYSINREVKQQLKKQNKSQKMFNLIEPNLSKKALRRKIVEKSSRYSHDYRDQGNKDIKPLKQQKSEIKKHQRSGKVETIIENKQQFDLSELKMEKKSRVTNPNTNQSRNSSSLLNSHGHSGIIEDYNKIMKIPHQNSNQYCQKIKKLIRNQQKTIKHQKIQSAKKSTLKDSIIKKCQKDFEQEKVVIENNFEKSKSNQKLNNYQNTRTPLEDKFKKSKFYVEELPQFKPIKNVVMNRNPEFVEEDSLLGCEITLMQNNLIESENSQLQLQ